MGRESRRSHDPLGLQAHALQGDRAALAEETEQEAGTTRRRLRAQSEL